MTIVIGLKEAAIDSVEVLYTKRTPPNERSRCALHCHGARHHREPPPLASTYKICIQNMYNEVLVRLLMFRLCSPWGVSDFGMAFVLGVGISGCLGIFKISTPFLVPFALN